MCSLADMGATSLAVAIGRWIVDNGGDEGNRMKRIVALIIVFGLLFGWLASAPPAWACSPPPFQPLLAPVIWVNLDNSRLNLISGPDDPGIELENIGLEDIFLLGPPYLKHPSPVEYPFTVYSPPTRMLVYGYLRPHESIALSDSDIYNLVEGMDHVDLLYTDTKDDDLEIPSPQDGVLLFGVSGREFEVLVRVSYVENENWYPVTGDCTLYFLSIALTLFFRRIRNALLLVILALATLRFLLNRRRINLED